eukprot:COSAG01_NODE_49616_length_370_cov_5.269373_1_plen_29_part_01
MDGLRSSIGAVRAQLDVLGGEVGGIDDGA